MEEWLMKTRVLQRTSFGTDPARLDGDARDDYIRWNTLAAIKELSEALDETSWKPWVDYEKFNRDEFIGELVDVLHFVANLLVTAGCTDSELSARYNGKMQVNAKRQADGYTDDGKCSYCHRKWVDLAHIGGKRHSLSTVCAECAEIQ
jgi:hypothetical protein